jgi:rhodanese-related sulfurtransferase
MNQTPLSDFAIPRLELVLDEIFAVPPASLFPSPPPPTTVEELAARCGRSPDEVMGILRRISVMSQKIDIEPEDLAARLAAGESLILLDVREPWEFETARLAGSILLATSDFATLLPRLVEAGAVVTVCHHGVRSHSAALWLRERGVPGAVSLAGGVEAWATRIDRQMPRY